VLGSKTPIGRYLSIHIKGRSDKEREGGFIREIRQRAGDRMKFAKEQNTTVFIWGIDQEGRCGTSITN